jgi:ribosomal-protein-alanine N-acetyltransferase
MYYSKKELPIETAAENLWQLCEKSYQHKSPWTKEQFDVDLTQELTDYCVWIEANQWKGFISYQKILDEIEISHVVIHQKFQGEGLGSQLLDHAILLFKEQGINSVFLEVRESNEGARRLYERKGFGLLNRRKNYYTRPKEDGLVMCLTIKEVKQ